MKKIYRYSRGLPRLINAACDRILLAGYTKDKTRIHLSDCGRGIRELKKERSFGSSRPRMVLVPALTLAVLILSAALYFLGA